MTAIEAAVQWAIQTANDNSHGYSQADRWGPDYDCSSFVISAWEAAGVHVRAKGASYTGKMRAAFIACGFVDVSSQVGLQSGYGIQAGDVLLNYSAHTCLAIGGGKVANCRTSEGHPQTGDQSGNEIRIQAYWNYPWNCCLRYRGNTETAKNAENPQKEDSNAQIPTPASGSAAVPAETKKPWKPATLQTGSKGKDVAVLQALLLAHGFKPGEIDGDFGGLTQAAVNAAQRAYGLRIDGVCGPLTWQALGLSKTLFEDKS